MQPSALISEVIYTHGLLSAAGVAADFLKPVSPKDGWLNRTLDELRDPYGLRTTGRPSYTPVSYTASRTLATGRSVR